MVCRPPFPFVPGGPAGRRADAPLGHCGRGHEDPLLRPRDPPGGRGHRRRGQDRRVPPAWRRRRVEEPLLVPSDGKAGRADCQRGKGI